MSLASTGATGVLWIGLEPTIIFLTHLTIKILVSFSRVPLKQLSVKTLIFIAKSKK